MHDMKDILYNTKKNRSNKKISTYQDPCPQETGHTHKHGVNPKPTFSRSALSSCGVSCKIYRMYQKETKTYRNQTARVKVVL